MQSDADINLMACGVLFIFLIFFFFRQSYAEHSKFLCHTTLLLNETKLNVLEPN